VCDGARARSELGFTPRIPIGEGIPKTVSWYRQAGWL
jgi:nucleoside-diphosphate-sugar epimerase